MLMSVSFVDVTMSRRNPKFHVCVCALSQTLPNASAMLYRPCQIRLLFIKGVKTSSRNHHLCYCLSMRCVIAQQIATHAEAKLSGGRSETGCGRMMTIVVGVDQRQ